VLHQHSSNHAGCARWQQIGQQQQQKQHAQSASICFYQKQLAGWYRGLLGQLVR
jgi:hypothetical protein